MKNYLNAKDRSRHIILTAMQTVVEELNESDSLTEEEHNDLNNAYQSLLAFNGSIFDRLGEPYRRKILQTMQSNTLRFVGKYSAQQEAINYSATEDLSPMINEIIDLKCCDCDRCDFVKCAVYALGTACDINARAETGCPFKW